jgi:zinc transporter
MDDGNGLIFAFALDGEERGKELGWDDVARLHARGVPLWIHLDRTSEGAATWLAESSGLAPIVQDALLAEETRPRSTALGDGLLVILRGVNLNPGADPEDMVALRTWLEATLLVSVRARKLMAVQDLREELIAGRGPRRVGDLLVEIADRLTDRMGPVIGTLDDRVDTLEDELLGMSSEDLRSTLGDLRRQAISLRRYIGPQREVLSRLQAERTDFLNDGDRLHLREIGDRCTRYVEDLDAARERAAVLHEELAARLAERMNRTMFLLSLIATVFLPLGFITGLLGINVGGIPGTDDPWAFAIVTVALVVLAGAEALLFRRLRLL